MKIKIIGLSCMFLIVNCIVAEGLAEPILRLTYDDRKALESLYWNDSMGFLSKELPVLDINYYLDVLPKHIAELENDLTKKRSGWTSPGMFSGIFYTLVAAIFAKMVTVPEFHKFMAGNFGNVTMPDSMLENLETVNFTDDQKRKLQQISIGKKYLSHEKYSNIFNYSQEELEKIDLLARQLAGKNAKNLLFKNTMPSVFFAIFAVYYFYEASNHVENTNRLLNEQIEQAQRLLELLKNEKSVRIGQLRYNFNDNNA